MNNLIVKVDKLKSIHPAFGVEKMYKTLKPYFIERDKFIDVFMSLAYWIKKSKNYERTTITTYLKYPNLIEGMSVIRNNKIWQTDISTLILSIKSEIYSLYSLIHYSGRTSQCVANNYIKVLSGNNVTVSMGFKTQGNTI